METNNNIKAWVVTADMGYGHNRAVYPLKEIAEEKIIIAGSGDAVTLKERKQWIRNLHIYEFFSRARSIPLIGKPFFGILDSLMHIPSFYPIRNLSNTTFQVNLLESSIKKGLCEGMLEKISTKRLPLVTSFYAPAIAADYKGFDEIYCIICDADINRVWVAKEPWESRIFYFAPCGKAAQRLKLYGVPDERIFLTGFPIPKELVGGKEMGILKKNLMKRLIKLDPSKRFWQLHGKNVEHLIDNSDYNAEPGPLTISYAVGGAGAQKEIGKQIALGLKNKILSGAVKLNLIAGIRENIRDYFISVKQQIDPDSENIKIIYSGSFEEYYNQFNNAMHETDILWTKPSEISFYCALGIPIIMTSPIGSQEKFNAQWLREIHAGIKQENPEYADQWLDDLLKKGRLAEAAWSGFLKARKFGTHNIIEVLQTGKFTKEDNIIFR